jgi:hypothetical protein
MYALRRAVSFQCSPCIISSIKDIRGTSIKFVDWFYRIILEGIHIHLHRSTSALKIVAVGRYASLTTLV